jgi:HSP20 family protein
VGSSEVPSANLRETNDKFIVELSAPGLKKDDFKVEIDDGRLVVSCEKEEEKKDEDKNYRRREFSYSSFCRTFELPDNAAEDKINATYADGILEVSIPKKEVTVSKPKKEIKVD